MKKLLLINLLLLINFNLLSQQSKLTWGATQKSSLSYIDKVLGKDKQGDVYVARIASEGSKYYLEKYDKNYSQVFSQRILLPKIGSNSLKYMDMIMMNNQVFMLATTVIKETRNGEKLKKNTIYLCKLNKDGNLDNIVPKKIGEVDAYNSYLSGGFEYSISEDGSKFLLEGRNAFYKQSKKFNQTKKKYFCYDKEFNLIWEKSFVEPFKSKKNNTENLNVDNNGNLIMLISVEQEKKSDGKIYTLYLYNSEVGEMKKREITLKDKWVSSILVGLNHKTNEIVITGYYSAVGNINYHIEGFFVSTIDLKSLSIKSQNKTKIAKELKDEMRCEVKVVGEILHKERGFRDLKVSHYFPLNGGGIAVAQINFLYEQNIDCNLMVVKFDSNGQVKWMRKIERFQTGYPSGTRYIANYNDEKNEMNIILDNFHANLISIDSSGKISTEELYKSKFGKTISFSTDAYHIVSDNKIICYGYSGHDKKAKKNFSLCEIDIK